MPTVAIYNMEGKEVGKMELSEAIFGCEVNKAVLHQAVVTYLAMSLADIVASSIIVEQVFALPGLGRLLVTSISNRDFPVALCIVVIIAFVVVFMNYLADIITQYIDPRVRLD